jgi:hypothetical protein
METEPGRGQRFRLKKTGRLPKNETHFPFSELSPKPRFSHDRFFPARWRFPPKPGRGPDPSRFRDTGARSMMTCGIVRQEVKRRTRTCPGPSNVFRRPRWKRERGSAEYVMTGDEIGRPLKYRWRIALTESGGNGSGRRQWYVCTIGYWDVVDDRYGKEKRGTLFSHARKRLETLFPDRDPDDIRDLLRIVETRFAPIRKSILAEYRESEEYYFRLIQNLVEQKRRESDLRGKQGGNGGTAGTRARQGGSARPASGNGAGPGKEPGEGPSGASARGNGSAGSAAGAVRPEAVPEIPGELEMALDMLRTGFRRVAAKYHPDTGGDTHRMQRLNLVRDRLERLCRQTFGKPETAKGRRRDAG